MAKRFLTLMSLLLLLTFFNCKKEETGVEDTTENGQLEVTYLDKNGHPASRDVIVDGTLRGQSGELIELTKGHHLVSLAGPPDYEKPTEQVTINEDKVSVDFRQRP